MTFQMTLHVAGQSYKVTDCKIHLRNYGQYRVFLTLFAIIPPEQCKTSITLQLQEGITWKIPLLVRYTKVVCQHQRLISIVADSPFYLLQTRQSDHLWVDSETHRILQTLVQPIWAYPIEQRQQCQPIPYLRQGGYHDAHLLERVLRRHHLSCYVDFQRPCFCIDEQASNPRSTPPSLAPTISQITHRGAHHTSIRASVNQWLPLHMHQRYALGQQVGELAAWYFHYHRSPEAGLLRIHTTIELVCTHKKAQAFRHVEPPACWLEKVALRTPSKTTMTYPCEHHNVQLHARGMAHYTKINAFEAHGRSTRVIQQSANQTAILLHTQDNQPAWLLGALPHAQSRTVAGFYAQKHQLCLPYQKSALQFTWHAYPLTHFTLDNHHLFIKSNTVQFSAKHLLWHHSHRIGMRSQQHAHNIQHSKITTKTWLHASRRQAQVNKKMQLHSAIVQLRASHLEQHTNNHHIQSRNVYFKCNAMAQHAAVITWHAQSSIQLQCKNATIMLYPDRLCIQGTQIHCQSA